jgi:lipoprotein-anchoring transpeptidase ErfK/SrfK
MLRSTVAIAALLLGCAVPAAEALAQYYPPYGYPPPPPAYRGAPPPVEVDDDDDDLVPDQPGAYRGAPYRGAPGEPDPYASRRYPGERYSRSAPPADPYGAPRPPADVYPHIQQPSYGFRPFWDRRPAYPPQPYAQPGQEPQGYEPRQGYDPRYDRLQPGYGAQQGHAQPGYEPRPPAATGRGDPRYAALPPDYQPEEGDPQQLPQQLRRQLVDYRTREPAGTMIVDTPNTFLYLVLGNGKALRYGIGVGREGFTWAGEERVSKMSEWPDWHPPADMIERQPYLPRFMAGGPGNPLGARALYLGKSLYRIHGTNQPSTIGQFVSSGCIRLLNEDIEDLFNRVTVGTRVVVLAGSKPATTGTVR